MTKNGDDSATDIENLIGAVREDIAKLTEVLAQALAAKGSEAKEAARQGLEDALDRGRKIADKLKGEASEAAESLQEMIETKPLMAVLIALFVGFFAGSLFRRR